MCVRVSVWVYVCEGIQWGGYGGMNFPSVALFYSRVFVWRNRFLFWVSKCYCRFFISCFRFFFGSRDGIGFCFWESWRNRVFLGRAFVPVVFLTTESVFVLGFHDEMPFCFGVSRRDAVLFWGFTTRCRFVLGVHDGIGFCFGGSRRDAIFYLRFVTSDERWWVVMRESDDGVSGERWDESSDDGVREWRVMMEWVRWVRWWGNDERWWVVMRAMSSECDGVMRWWSEWRVIMMMGWVRWWGDDEWGEVMM